MITILYYNYDHTVIIIHYSSLFISIFNPCFCYESISKMAYPLNNTTDECHSCSSTCVFHTNNRQPLVLWFITHSLSFCITTPLYYYSTDFVL